MSFQKIKSHPLLDTVISILHALLDQAEQPQRQHIARVRLEEKQYPDYWDRMNFQPRDTINQAFQTLAKQGIVDLRWRKQQENNWLASVDLVTEHIEAVYALLKRTPINQQEQALRDLIAQQSPIPGWHANFLNWADHQCTNHLSVTPLDLARPQHNARLLQALSAIATLEEPVLERILSIRLYGNSKELEPLRPALLSVLRRYAPDTKLYGDDEKALLRAYNVETVPEHIVLAGPLTLLTDRGSLDLSHFFPSVAPSAVAFRSASGIVCTASTIITIENATSFTELSTMRPETVLLVFTGGFASPTILRILKTIRLAHPKITFFHWGDLDVGGLRILAHLRLHLGNIAPLAMDRETFEAHKQYGQALSTKEQNALVSLQAHPNLQDMLPLIDGLLAARQKLEQEAIRPPWFINDIHNITSKTQ
jgi:hypothetical protein